ncbi:MAG: DNA-binding protein [Chloroflexi bacterium]|nr:DNA-binding protein [Chloroflexota bacterium]
MAEAQTVVIATSVLFSALVRDESTFTELLLHSNYRLFICEYVFVELFKPKAKLMQSSQLSEEEILRLLYIILRRINVYKESLIRFENRQKAFELCKDIDEKDTPHVALALELDALLWTGDKKLKNALKKKGFTQFFVPPKT